MSETSRVRSWRGWYPRRSERDCTTARESAGVRPTNGDAAVLRIAATEAYQPDSLAAKTAGVSLFETLKRLQPNSPSVVPTRRCAVVNAQQTPASRVISSSSVSAAPNGKANAGFSMPNRSRSTPKHVAHVLAIVIGTSHEALVTVRMRAEFDKPARQQFTALGRRQGMPALRRNLLAARSRPVVEGKRLSSIQIAGCQKDRGRDLETRAAPAAPGCSCFDIRRQR